MLQKLRMESKTKIQPKNHYHGFEHTNAIVNSQHIDHCAKVEAGGIAVCHRKLYLSIEYL